MADDIVLNSGAGGATIATDQIGTKHYQWVKIAFGADEAANKVTSIVPLPVALGVDSPQVTAGSVAAVAAGLTGDIDSAQITSGKTGKLVSIEFGSTVACKGELKTVLNNVESAVKLRLIRRPGETRPWVSPNWDFITQVESATAGFDGFRLTVTNLDTSEPADIYATYFYDEV